MVYQLTLHPALDGDCMTLEWGEATRHHLVVDLGRGTTYKSVRGQLQVLENVELFVMTHIDADHIAGAMPLVKEARARFTPKRVWYNSRPQLVAAQDRQPIHEPFGARQGEKLARGIVAFNWPWNAEFASEIVSTDSAEARQPIGIAPDLTLRLLSPNDSALEKLLPVWDAELAKAHLRTFDPDVDEEPLGPQFEPLGGAPDVAALAAAPFHGDHAEANATSIAFLAEFGGRRVLLTGDAHSDILEASIRPLAEAEGGRLRVDLWKVGHHGSKANTSPALVQLVDCTRFAFSTNGDRHGHPDPETIARILVADAERMKTLYFNYRQPIAEQWESQLLKRKWQYATVFPAGQPANGTLAISV